jgi:hypothetical protein
VKKLLLTSIAALFLATGTALAQPTNYFGNPVGSTGPVYRGGQLHPLVRKAIADARKKVCASRNAYAYPQMCGGGRR